MEEKKSKFIEALITEKLDKINGGGWIETCSTDCCCNDNGVNTCSTDTCQTYICNPILSGPQTGAGSGAYIGN